MTGKMLVIGLVSVTLGCAFTAAATSVPTPLVTRISADPGQRAGRSQRFTAIASFVADLPRALSSTPIAAGGSHSCALLVDGTVDCWGRNASGQLGDGTFADSNRPASVAGITAAIAMLGSVHRADRRVRQCGGPERRHGRDHGRRRQLRRERVGDTRGAGAGPCTRELCSASGTRAALGPPHSQRIYASFAITSSPKRRIASRFCCAVELGPIV